LGDPKLVLLVHDHQGQPVKGHVLLEQRVRTHHQVGLSGCDLRPARLPFPPPEASREEDRADAQGLQQPAEGEVVLLRQDFRGRHDRRLAPPLDRDHHRGCSHHGLSGAHLSLQQAVHGMRGMHVPCDLLDGSLLGPGEGEGQGGKEGLQHPALRPVPVGFRGSGHLPPAQQEGQLEDQELLEGQPPPGNLGLLQARREVHGPQSVGEGQKPETLPNPLRKGLGDPPGILLDRGVDHPSKDPGGKALRDGMDRDDAACMEGRSHSLREDLELRVFDLDLPEGPAHPTPNHDLRAGLEGFVEVPVPPELQHAHRGAVRHVYLRQGPPRAELRGVQPHHGGPEGSVLAMGSVVEAAEVPPILIPARDVVQEVLHRVQAQTAQLSREGGTHTPDRLYASAQLGRPSRHPRGCVRTLPPHLLRSFRPPPAYGRMRRVEEGGTWDGCARSAASDR
jgi:hypothetical protein